MRTNKFEQLIEYIINEDEDKAKSLFHQIVVEKSRDIYEGLEDQSRFPIQRGRGAESLSDEIESHEDTIDGDEHGVHEDEVDLDDTSLDAGTLDDENDEFSDDDASVGGEEELGGEELGGEEELEDRVMDLEDAIDELKAEFDELMAGEAAEEENVPGIHDADGESELDSDEGEEGVDDEEDLGGEEQDESRSVYEAKKAKKEIEEKKDKKEIEEKKVKESRKSPADLMREYVEKVTVPSNKSESGELVGTGTESDKPTVNKKSTQIGGKNDMGGTTANIARGGAETAPDGTSPKKASNYGTKGEGKLPHAGSFENVPGGRAGQAFKKATKPASAEGSPAGAKNTAGGTINVKSPDQATGGKPGFRG
jgi:hypothetical protein